MTAVPTERNSPAVRLPARRRLRTFAFDPMSTRLSGRYLRVDVPFEHGLQRGPAGELVHVVDYDATRETWYSPVNLDDPAILAQDGLRPSEGDPRAHQQIVYAVSMSVIERVERFLGRRFRWRKERPLLLAPHAFEGRNAFFDPGPSAVLFGYYRANRDDPGENLPGQVMFTCLSSDVVAHEVTHAIVHRLRRYYAEATNPDVFAWHEAAADLVALFQHFVHEDVVEDAIAATQGDLRKHGGLLDLAQEFGRSTGRGKALRSALGSAPDPVRFAALTEPHERGAEFVAAVFEAYVETYQKRIADLLRIATGGTGVLPPGRLHPDLVKRVADEAVINADRLLGMVVRSFDYLPVVDVTFGDVVRAIVTADRALHPDDGLHLRGTLVESLRRRGIYPSRVASLTDESLAWPRPLVPLNVGPHPHLILSATQDLDVSGLHGDVATDDDDEDAYADTRRSEFRGPMLGWADANWFALGLDPRVPISLQGVHVAYRLASDHQPRPELVIQFAQQREDLAAEAFAGIDGEPPPVRAGTTVIARVDGTVEHVVAKPLPLSDLTVLDGLPDANARAAREHHAAGEARWRALKEWYQVADDADALSIWTSEPAVRRMTFANLHASIDEGSA